MDTRMWQHALSDSGRDPYSWCTETHPKWVSRTCKRSAKSFCILVCTSNNKALCLSPRYIITPRVSGALTQAIRNFAKSLENWLTGALMNIPEEMVRIKVLVHSQLNPDDDQDHAISLAWETVLNGSRVTTLIQFTITVSVGKCDLGLVIQLQEGFTVQRKGPRFKCQWCVWGHAQMAEDMT